MSEKFLLALFDDDDVLLNAIKTLREKQVRIYDVYTPFAVHNMDETLGLKDTRLHNAGFFYGMFGTSCAVLGITWIYVWNFPSNFDGKPHFALPAWIPITFEFTVLCAAVGMFLTMLYRSNLWPGNMKMPLEPRSSDDRFTIAFKITNETTQQDIDNWTALSNSLGAVEVKHAER